MKGLNSYNILQNPFYKDAFGITWKFALEHTHVSEIRFDQGAAVDEDEDVEKIEKQRRSNQEYEIIVIQELLLNNYKIVKLVSLDVIDCLKMRQMKMIKFCYMI